MIEEARVSGWREAKEIAEREAERRLGGRIRDVWVDTIRLTPHWEGDTWIVKLRIVLEKGMRGREGYLISAEIDPFTGEVKRFEAETPKK